MNNTNQYATYQEGLIKTLLANPKDVSRVMGYVNSDDFDDSRYALIYDTIKTLDKNDEPITLPSIVGSIYKVDPESHLDPSWIMSLDTNITKWTTQAPPMTWARLLKTESARHKAGKVIKESMQDLGSSNPVDLLGNLSKELDDIAKDTMETEEDTVDKDIEGYLDFMDERNQVATDIIPSPYPSLDQYTRGWVPKALITVGARTSVGKSVVAVQSALYACMAGKSVYLASLEMSKYEIIDRMVAAMAMVSLNHIRTGNLSVEERKNFNDALQLMKKFKLVIDDTANVTVDYIKQKAVSLSQKPDGLDMIIIDYLQLIGHSGRKGSTRQEIVADISRSMKVLAKQLNVPVMVLAQLNRESKDDTEDRLPRIFDIRESAAIAADSDVVLLIHRKIDSDSIDPKALFLLEKNRNGANGKKITVRANLEYSTFLDDPNNPAQDEYENTPENVDNVLESPMEAAVNNVNEYTKQKEYDNSSTQQPISEQNDLPVISDNIDEQPIFEDNSFDDDMFEPDIFDEDFDNGDF